jgi:hypothetical protein
LQFCIAYWLCVVHWLLVEHLLHIFYIYGTKILKCWSHVS